MAKPEQIILLEEQFNKGISNLGSLAYQFYAFFSAQS